MKVFWIYCCLLAILPFPRVTGGNEDAQRDPNKRPGFGKVRMIKPDPNREKCPFEWNEETETPFQALTNGATELHGKGRTSDAIACLLHASDFRPRSPAVWANLALMNLHINKYQEAQQYARKAFDLTDKYQHGETHYKLSALLGETYVRSGRYEAALPYLRAAAYFINSANAWRQLGTVYDKLNQREKAFEVLKKVVEVTPPDQMFERTAALANLASEYRTRGAPEKAIPLYREAIALDRRGRVPEARHNLALLYHYDLKQYDDAIKYYQDALKLRPDFPEVRDQLSKLYTGQGKHEEAINILKGKGSMSSRPSFDNLLNLAQVYIAKRELGQAREILLKASAMDPRHGQPHVMLAYVHTLESEFDDAKAEAEIASTMVPTSTTAHTFTLLGQIAVNRQDFRNAITNFQKAYDLDATPRALSQLAYTQNRVNDWSNAKVAFAQLSEYLANYDLEGAQQEIVSPMEMFTFPFGRIQQRAISEIHAEFIKRKARRLPKPQPRSIHHGDGKRKRLKLGYMSTDFRQHPTGLLVLGTLLAHDSRRFEVFCYDVYNGHRENDDIVQAQVKKHVEHYSEVSQLSAKDLASRIAEDQIDVLVDLNGYYSELLYRSEVIPLHPAPLQIQFMMFPATMGTYDVQYIVTDAITTPPWFEDAFAEWFLIAPRLYHINYHKVGNKGVLERSLSSPARRVDHGLPEYGTVFCNFGQAFKITEQVFSAWLDILKNVPTSVLWLVAYPSASEEYIRSYLRNHGVPQARVVFAPKVAVEDHLHRLPLCDLFLDTQVCSSHTTAVDALWMRVPVLTIMGSTMAQRAGSSIVAAAGLPQLVTHSLEEYSRLAISLGQDKKALQELRNAIQSDAVLFDTEALVRDYESLLQQAWELHITNEGGMHVIGSVQDANSR